MLYSDNGINIVLQKLDTVFHPEETQDTYFTESNFSNFRQQQIMSMNDFITEFENLNYKKVLTFELLIGASGSENQRQICLTLSLDIGRR